VAHADYAPTPVLATPTGGSLLSAGQVKLAHEEHQGSLHVQAKTLADCGQVAVATIARSGQNTLLKGTFAACKGSWRLEICSPLPAHLRLRATVDAAAALNRLTFTKASTASERFYGMGEQFPHDTLNLNGRKIPVLAQEGGVGRGHQPISAAVNLASKGSAGSEDSTYYAAGHVLSDRGYSLVLENETYAEFDMKAAAATSIHVYDDQEIAMRVIVGASPLQLIERFTEYAGRMPPPPEWVNNGAIVALARPLSKSLQIVADLQKNGVQIAGVWNQTWSGIAKTFIGEQVLWNWTANPHAHPDWNKWVGQLQAKGIRTLCYINSMLRDVPKDVKVTANLYKEAEKAGFFVQKKGGGTYLLPVTAFDVGLIDLSNPAARTWLKKLIAQELIAKAGCSGWMADFAEALPFDAVMHDGATGYQWHNRYPVAWAQLNKEAVAEAGKKGDILVFNRSGHTRSPGSALFFWQGDQLTTWDKYDGLVSALRGLINGGFSGISLNHSDIGGYTSLSKYKLGYKREAEQLKRWAEMAAFTALFRTHEGNQPGANAQVYSSKDAMQHFGRMSKVFKALGPYRKTLYEQAASKGWPVVRHLALHYPGDKKSWTVDDQFLMGSELLVAPIKNKCFTKPLCPYDKKLYLPPGKWVHLWSGKAYGDAAAGKTVSVKAPLGKPAVFFKQGSKVGADLVKALKAAGVMN